MVGKLRLRMIYTFVKSLYSPATKFSSGDIVHTATRFSTPLQVQRIQPVFQVPLQIRIPAIISSQRPRFVLRAQLFFDTRHPPPSTASLFKMPKQTRTSLKRHFDHGIKNTARIDAGLQASSDTVFTQPAMPQGGGRKKKKVMSPEVQARLSIQMAAKTGDVQAAFAAFDAAVEQNLKLPADTYVTLMFLASGGDEWEDLLEHNTGCDEDNTLAAIVNHHNNNNNNNNNNTSTLAPIIGQQQQQQDVLKHTADGDSQEEGDIVDATKKRKSLDSLHDFLGRCSDVMKTMQQAGYYPNEMCYTALARRDALLGKAEDAFARAQELVQLNSIDPHGKSSNNTRKLAVNSSPRLRCFAPALAAYAVRHDAVNAFRVYDALLSIGLEPTESEYKRVVQAARGGAVPWQRVDEVLRRIAKELTVLTPGTIQQLKHLFDSKKEGRVAGDGDENSTSTAPLWMVDDECTVDDAGLCSTIPGARLEAIDLNEEEYSEFKKGIAEIAARQERQPNNFKSFVEWLNENGPYSVVVDGANVAFYGQNYETGGFSFAQIEAVVNRAHELYPHLRPLVLLHVNREKMPQAKTPSSQAFLADLRSKNQFYATPLGSNDDWYWIYCAVAAGTNGILISNDEMRDHMFNLLAPKFFYKWKQRHQMRYIFSGTPSSLEFSLPPPYTTCSQYLEEHSMWVFPCSDGTWMSARMRKE